MTSNVNVFDRLWSRRRKPPEAQFPFSQGDVVRQISVFIRAGLITSQQLPSADLKCTETLPHRGRGSGVSANAHHYTKRTHLQNAQAGGQRSEGHPHI